MTLAKSESACEKVLDLHCNSTTYLVHFHPQYSLSQQDSSLNHCQKTLRKLIENEKTTGDIHTTPC